MSTLEMEAPSSYCLSDPKPNPREGEQPYIPLPLWNLGRCSNVDALKAGGTVAVKERWGVLYPERGDTSSPETESCIPCVPKLHRSLTKDSW